MRGLDPQKNRKKIKIKKMTYAWTRSMQKAKNKTKKEKLYVWARPTHNKKI